MTTTANSGVPVSSPAAGVSSGSPMASTVSVTSPAVPEVPDPGSQPPRVCQPTV